MEYDCESVLHHLENDEKKHRTESRARRRAQRHKRKKSSAVLKEKEDYLKQDNNYFKISLSKDRKSINFENVGRLKSELMKGCGGFMDRKASTGSAQLNLQFSQINDNMDVFQNWPMSKKRIEPGTNKAPLNTLSDRN